MNLTDQWGNYLNLLALETYVSLVEDECIPLLPTAQRLGYIEALVARVVYDLGTIDNKKKDLPRVYKRTALLFFENEVNNLKVWNQFSVAQAEKDGILSPERIVDELLEGIDASYAQKSTLQSHALKYIAKAKRKGYDVPTIINSVQYALRRNGAYKRICPQTRSV